MGKKTISIILTAILALGTCVGCNDSDNATSSEYYQEQENSFVASISERWNKRIEQGDYDYVINAYENEMISTYQSNETLTDIYNEAKKKADMSSCSENTLAKNFIKRDSEDVAKNIYDKLMSEHIYCQYGQSDGEDNIVYFRNSGYKLEDRSWIEVNSPKKIILYNPDSDYLKIYFNRIVPLWDNQTKGNEIIDELKSKTYEDDDGYRYNIIKKNDVEYHIYYYLKNRYKIHYIYIVFQYDENSNK